jgi:hypothetical protein
MRKANGSKKRLLTDIKLAQKKFECYEKIYIGLDEEGKRYLQSQSKLYKEKVANIQKLIQPSLKRNCPTCINCCKLYTPELSIYIAGTIGCFEFIDYLLVRYDTVLPNPNLENMKNNLCPYWDEGCILPSDCRSFSCTKYFCDALKTEIDMKIISGHLSVIEALLDNFSIKKCLGMNTLT